MSYNLVDSTTGALTRVAGRGKAEYGASSVRSGTYIPSGPVQAQEDLSFSVTFSEPMPDNDYQVIFGSSSNSVASGTIQCVVRSRSTTGFTGVIRNVGPVEISVASGTFTWFAFKLYSDVEYSNIVNSMPSDASASNKLVTESDTNSITLTSTDSLASWAGNAKGVMTAFIGTSSKPSDIGAPLSSWGETMIWCIGHDIRKTLFAIDYSVAQHVIYTREYYNGSFITNWTAIKDGNLTSSVISGSTAPITSGGVYDYLAGSPLIGQVTTTLGRLGFGAPADNFLEIKVCPSIEITNSPFGDSGNCLYIKMGIVEFVVGALSADESQWTPNTGVAYRVRHGSTWQSWHILKQD